MSRKMNSLLAAMIPLALMSENFGQIGNDSNDLRPQDIDTTPKEKPIPKGCKRFYFDRGGICCKSESEVYFDAMKPSKAREKYERWLSKLNEVV
jgi:hypothetical protein